MFAIWIV